MTSDHHNCPLPSTAVSATDCFFLRESIRLLSVCLSCLSVTLVYCGQTVECIKTKLGVQLGLVPGHSPQFSAHISRGQRAGWIKMPLVTEVGIGLDDTLLDGDPAPPKRGTAPNFRPIYCRQMAGCIRVPLGTEVGLSPDDIALDGASISSPSSKGAQPPVFSPCILWPTAG